MSASDLYEAMLDLFTLLPQDRAHLRQRGFTDEVIERYCFRSCCADNARHITTLMDKFGLETLFTANVIEQPREQYPQMQEQLLKPNILIPYRGADGRVTKLRPHKLGLPGDPAQVFRTLSVGRRASHCIVAESEYKAIAAEMLGYPALGIPGISSMVGRNWDYFRWEIQQLPVSTYVVCFDNEVKDNTAYPNYKADWRRRYDTLIYAYAMAQRLTTSGKTATVAVLPAAWITNGKIDIDLALAQGRTPMDFKDVIDAATTPEKFLECAMVPKEHQSFVKRRLHRFFHRSPVFVKNNSFYSLDDETTDASEGITPEQESSARRLTNCYIYVKHVYEEEGTDLQGVRRDVVVVDEFGLESRPTALLPSHMSSKSAINQWLMAQGNFLFYGRDSDVQRIWEHVFVHDEGGTVTMLDHCGYDEERKFYLFRNMLISTETSQMVPANEYGICWYKDVGYKINPPTTTLHLPVIQPDAHFDLPVFLEYLHNTVDKQYTGHGKAMFAWFLAVLFLQPIVDALKFFPLLFVYGERQAGKTTVLGWLQHLFGFDTNTYNLATSSNVGLTRGLGFYSHIPLLCDDWRDDREFEKYKKMFLGIYNRQSGLKGVRSRFGLQAQPIRGALAIAGEEMINDEGVMSRCVTFYIQEQRLREVGTQMGNVCQNASALTYRVLTQGYAASAATVVRRIHEYDQRIRKALPGVNPRVVLNFCTLLAAYTTVIGEDVELERYILTRIGETSQESLHRDKMHKFAEEFASGVTESHLQFQHYKIVLTDTDGPHIVLWVKGIVDKMNLVYKRNTDPTLLLYKHFQRQPYFVRALKAQFAGSPLVLPAVELSINRMPESIRHYYYGVASEELATLNTDDPTEPELIHSGVVA